MEQNSFHLIEQASEMSKITLSVIVYAPCPSKTIIKTNKKQMNSSADTFFLNDPLPRAESLVKVLIFVLAYDLLFVMIIIKYMAFEPFK